MPRLEPVTTATLPVRSNGVFFIVGFSLLFSARHCEERSDEAIHSALWPRWIASLRSQ
jgi:hypothetical protein